MNPPIVLAGIALIGVVYVLLPVAGDAFVRFRAKRRLWCPETGDEAEVGLDARHAALTATIGHPDLRIKDCSLWPGRQGCAQGCVSAIETPEGDRSRAPV